MVKLADEVSEKKSAIFAPRNEYTFCESCFTVLLVPITLPKVLEQE